MIDLKGYDLVHTSNSTFVPAASLLDGLVECETILLPSDLPRNVSTIITKGLKS